MARYLAGVGSALLLVIAGVLVWKSQAQSENIVPPAPASVASTVEPALAAPPSAEKSREEKRFARYDGDEDGIITRAEMMDTRRKPFAKLDKDGNGSLSFEEWAVATADKFGKADADRSGTLNSAEFATTKRETKPRRCAC
jgi:hypothetical protein